MLRHDKYMVSGFSLIEAIVYIALSILIASLLFTTALQFHTSLKRLQKNAHAYAALQAAGDLLARDIQMAPADTAQWKKTNATELIWHIGKIDRGWRLHNGRLERAQGRYNAASGRWIKSTKGLAVDNVRQGVFETHVRLGTGDKKYIAMIGITLRSKHLSDKNLVHKSVCPRNRKI